MYAAFVGQRWSLAAIFARRDGGLFARFAGRALRLTITKRPA